jgi:hypothetical protein
MIQFPSVTGSQWAHLLGFVGELSNLIGAIVLARDLLARDEESAERERLFSVSQWAVKSHLKSTVYRGQNVAAPDFARSIVDLRSKVLAYKGISLLVLGFALLAVYHFWELLIS